MLKSANDDTLLPKTPMSSIACQPHSNGTTDLAGIHGILYEHDRRQLNWMKHALD
jgi:hypothetical protein